MTRRFWSDARGDRKLLYFFVGLMNYESTKVASVMLEFVKYSIFHQQMAPRQVGVSEFYAPRDLMLAKINNGGRKFGIYASFYHILP